MFTDLKTEECKLTEDFQILGSKEAKEVGQIIHTQDTRIDEFDSALQQIRKEHNFFVNFSLDGRYYDPIWMYKKSKDLLSLFYTEPFVCWICNRIFMKDGWYYYQNSEWLDGLHRQPWCSPACQVKYASFQLARKRKAERQAIDRSTVCQQCGAPFIPKRLGSSFCSSNCRLKNHRLNKKLIAGEE